MLHATVLLWAMNDCAIVTIIDSTSRGDYGGLERGAPIDQKSNGDDRFRVRDHILLVGG